MNFTSEIDHGKNGDGTHWVKYKNPMAEIQLSLSAYGTADVVIFNMPNTKLVDWFSIIDVWGSPGYDRFNNGGLYFEIPKEMYDIIPTLPFISKYHIKVTKY